MSNLRTCARCKSNIDVSYFSLNRKKQLYKTCDNCRNPKKENDTSLLERINEARTYFINTIVNESKGSIKYIGQVNPDDVNYPHKDFPELKGCEVTVEYHLFMLTLTRTPSIVRWRCKD